MYLVIVCCSIIMVNKWTELSHFLIISLWGKNLDSALKSHLRQRPQLGRRNLKVKRDLPGR